MFGSVVEMPSASIFRSVASAVAGAVPESAVVVGLEVSAESSHVTVWTTTPMLVIGSRGRTAEMVRDAIAAAVGHPVRLKVELADGDVEDGSGRVANDEQLTRRDLDPVLRPRIPRPPA